MSAISLNSFERKRKIEDLESSDTSSSYGRDVQEVARAVLDPSNSRGHQDIRALLAKFPGKVTEKKTELAHRLTVLFREIKERNERGRIFDTANGIAKSQLNDVLERALPFFEKITDGYQRAAVLHAISKISEKERSHVLKYARTFFSSVRDGYHLASIIRVIDEIPKGRRKAIFQQAEKMLEASQDGLHAAAILRALHTTGSQNVMDDLCYSVGDPEVEDLLQEWDPEAKDVSLKESEQLREIESAICEAGIPSNLKVCEISADVGEGLFARSDIKKGDVIGLYTGILELVPKIDRTISSYVYNLTNDIDGRSFSLCSGQMHGVTRVAVDEDGNVVPRSANGERFIIQVNAELMGNYTRRINHGQSNNVSPKLVKLEDGGIEVLLIAAKSIKAGDQLLLDYGASYWRALGIQPKEIESDTYRLENDIIVEKPKESEPKIETPSLSSATQVFKSVSKDKKASAVELVKSQPVRNGRLEMESSSKGENIPSARRATTKPVSKFKKVAGLERGKSKFAKKTSLQVLPEKRARVLTAEYLAYRQSQGFES